MVPIELLQFLAGGMGGFIRAIVGITKSADFNPDNFKFEWMKFLITIVVSIIVGQMAGIVFNSDWRTSLLAGYAGSDLIESLYRMKFDKPDSQ